MLKIFQLSVSVLDKTIIKNCSQDFAKGLTHVIMGPNGSGKSSLVMTIMGHPSYQITEGKMFLDSEDISLLPTHQRAEKRIFLAMQHPVEIQGLKVIHFLQEIYNKAHKTTITITDLLEKIEPLLKLVGLSESILERSVNVGFSGGEKKRFELLQILLIQPQLVILDELDSGVDIDGLKHLADGLNSYKAQFPDVTIIMITHYGHILKYLKSDQIHVMIDGAIVASGDESLISTIEQNGYSLYAKRSE